MERPAGVVAIASDHAALEMKDRLRDALAGWGYAVQDLSPATGESVDYPDYAEAVASSVSGGRAALGVLVCGTGIGMSIAANKFPAVRAALLYDDFAARHARLHNDANVAVFGSRTMTVDAAVTRLRIFLSEPFEGGRHARRLEKIGRIEKRLGPQA
ncbi:MAG: ribose 5-phosphate isomerase B [Deltaproteobacteria bacterium]|nr:ribose 5-phosphate isomerase B [Candidatus Deferrimicrobiaceae bacterium]